jgi:putative PIN family toxin of toxin-antitoxin system
MRVVLDTNTIISGLFWGGVPWQVYSAAFAEHYTLLTTDDLLNELMIVLNRPKFVQSLAIFKRTAEDIVSEYRQVAEFVIPAEIPSDVIRDPKDRAVLACAVGGKADFIVSGDKDLLILRTYENIRILNAAQFRSQLNQE